MKQTLILAGLVLTGFAYGMPRTPPTRRADSPTSEVTPRAPVVLAEACQPERKIEDVIATKFDVELKSLALVDVIHRLERMVVEASPDLKDRFELRLSGNDLKAEGITRNQRIAQLKLKQKTFGEILTATVRIANPDRSVREASDARQKLVWAIGSANDPRKYVILVTTRAGATARGLQLPEAFQAADDPGNALGQAGQPASWSAVISAETLEDEIKRISAALPRELATLRTFSGRGYRECRMHFSELALLFGVISQYDQPVRWKSNAAPMAKACGRTAYRCTTGTEPVYQAAQRRRDDLAELVRGGEIPAPAPEGPIGAWSKLYHRAEVMKRMHQALDKLVANVEHDQNFAAQQDTILHEAGMLVLISTVLGQPGSEDTDDEDYADYAKQLTSAAQTLRDSVKLNDQKRATAAVGGIKHACTQCHEAYR